MEVTLLVHATDQAFEIIENARKQAIELLDSTVGLSAEEQRWMEEKRVRTLFTGAQAVKTRRLNFLGTFFILFGVWAILSGHFDAFHLSLGVICCGLIAYMSYDLLFANVRVVDMRTIVKRFIAYIPWLIEQIILANIHVAGLALNPKMPIDPKIVRFKTKLESDVSWVTLANSITLTPGTITVDIKEGEYYVHALSKKVADELLTGEMEDRVAHIYMEADHIYIQDVLDMTRIYGLLRGIMG
jgi:multicomponent Na+:H+ antiporter subunit E